MKVLFAASEGSPFLKTGGLGDVIGSLPKALQSKKTDVRIIMPKYQAIPDKYQKKMTVIKEFTVPLSWRNQYCAVKKTQAEGVTYYFIENEYYFKRTQAYGHFDDAERYAFFCKAILEALPYIDFKPDILHCHDWQTALACLYLKAFYKDREFYKGIKTCLTIHNLAYQGIFSKDILGDVLGLDDEYFNLDGLEFYGQVNLLKAGLNYADALTTVSETYAQEIQSPAFGEKLEGVLQKRAHQLYGITNGIDTKKYPKLSPEEKTKYKLQLQQALGLEVNKDIPLIAIVSRLTEQKGLELVGEIMPDIISLGTQMVVLGNGEERYEAMFKEGEARYPGKISANITFNEELAQKIFSAGDIFLMPSKFEPCGISQMIALRHGCIPVVRATGGLKDTIVPFNKLTGTGNGFSFINYNAQELLDTLGSAVECYRDKRTWSLLLKNAQKSENGWEKAAKRYIDLYNSMLSG